MANPGFAGDARAVLPVAGDDADARASIVELANEMGFEAVGGLDAAGTLEAAARYWGLLAFAGGLGRGIALGVLHGR
jgi:predicted dinucleotide-binding enzyme